MNSDKYARNKKNTILEVKNTLIGLKKVNNSEKISAFQNIQWK